MEGGVRHVEARAREGRRQPNSVAGGRNLVAGMVHAAWSEWGHDGRKRNWKKKERKKERRKEVGGNEWMNERGHVTFKGERGESLHNLTKTREQKSLYSPHFLSLVFTTLSIYYYLVWLLERDRDREKEEGRKNTWEEERNPAQVSLSRRPEREKSSEKKKEDDDDDERERWVIK